MPITTAFRVPSIGLETDYKNVDWVDHVVGHYTPTSICVAPRPRGILTVHFKNGTQLTLGADVECQQFNKVELVEGRIYHMGKDGVRWLALCRNNSNGVLKLYPLDKGRAPIFADKKHNYTFYKEFDLDLKEYM